MDDGERGDLMMMSTEESLSVGDDGSGKGELSVGGLEDLVDTRTGLLVVFPTFVDAE